MPPAYRSPKGYGALALLGGHRIAGMRAIAAAVS
jgi:hypothetical protein